MKYLAYAIAIFTDILQLVFFIVFWALEPVTAVSGPIGTVLDMALSIVFGFVLIILLWAEGAFYPGLIFGVSVIEVLPIVGGISPTWTFVVWRCFHKKKNEEEKAAQAKSTSEPIPIQTNTRPFEDIKHAQAA
ncbi:MAG: hypothetical protein AAB919_00755 [Patescibacteria group bacterium]